MHSSLVVADHLLALEQKKKSSQGLTPMQLIKLVYLCHGWMLGLYGRPLLVDSIEAWRYGPVIVGLYQAVKQFRASPVIGRLSEDKGNFDDEEESVMEQVFKIYGGRSGFELSRLTHAPDTPWSVVRNAGWEIIPNDMIKEHFQELAESA